MSNNSVVEYFAEHEKYRCGYCGSSDTNYSHGMWTHSLTIQDYEDLIDRGWRRSGSYTYKPTMNQTCCPQYPIRCNALEFKLSKSQKKVIKKVNRFLNTGLKPKNELVSENSSEAPATEHRSDEIEGASAIISHLSAGDMNVQKHLEKADEDGNDIVESSESTTTKTQSTAQHDEKEPVCDINSVKKEDSESKKNPRKGDGADPTKPPCKKAKLRRKEAKLQKQQLNPAAQNKLIEKKKEVERKSLEEYLDEVVENPVHQLELRLVRNEESFKESLAVFKKYQMKIHKEKAEDCDRSSYKGFLVDSPLQAEYRRGGFPDGLGSFHQQYVLDGKIIAVGVLDILPHCVSSVYLFYDPEYEFLSLGTYSALREIAFIRHLNTFEPDLKYYYMGFYIHSCPKMRYKGNYYPSFLNCPETYLWYPIEECVPKLDISRYSRFAEAEKVDENGRLEIDKLLILHQRVAMPYRLYRSRSANNDQQEVAEYGQFVGNTVAQRMLLFRK